MMIEKLLFGKEISKELGRYVKLEGEGWGVWEMKFYEIMICYRYVLRLILLFFRWFW